MSQDCWCEAKVKALEHQVRQGILKSDYCKTEAKEGDKWVTMHEWTVSAAGTKLYCRPRKLTR